MPQNILEVKIRKLFYVLEMGVSFKMLALLLSQLISKSLPLTALEFPRKNLKKLRFKTAFSTQ